MMTKTPMKLTQLIMGMPVTIEITDLPQSHASDVILECMDYLRSVDEQFSPYKESSEVTKINHGLIHEKDWSDEMKEVMNIAEKTKEQTFGYFNVYNNEGMFDPSGIVKGWAIQNIAHITENSGSKHYSMNVGGDIALSGHNTHGKPWAIGIKNPMNTSEIVKVLSIERGGVATSGSYERGNHIYNPLYRSDSLDDVLSITVIGPTILEADRFATAAFAMGKRGVEFIESMLGFEAYQIDRAGIATQTSHFTNYVVS